MVGICAGHRCFYVVSSGYWQAAGDRGGVGVHEAEDLPGDGSLEAAFDLAGGFALGLPSGCVGLGGLVDAEPAQGNGVQGPVELAVAGAVEPVASHGAAAGGDGRRAGERGEGRFGADPASV